MDAHEKLMQALYAAVRQGGSGLSRTQMMRQARPTIAELRGLGASWIWIAARIERVRANGIEEPVPKAGDLDAPLSSASTGPVRAAFVRIQKMEGAPQGSLPAVRAGPKKSPVEVRVTAPASPSVLLSDSAETSTKSYLEKLERLQRPST